MTIISIALIAFGIRLSVLGSQSKKMDPSLGLRGEQLTKCPEKPNCIISFYPEDESHYMEPIETSLSLDEIKNKILNSDFNWKIKRESIDYVHFLNESKLMGFVDDIELYKKENKLHFRSASRVGYSDLGANKKRMKKLKEFINAIN